MTSPERLHIILANASTSLMSTVCHEGYHATRRIPTNSSMTFIAAGYAERFNDASPMSLPRRIWSNEYGRSRELAIPAAHDCPSTRALADSTPPSFDERQFTPASSKGH